MNTFDSTTNYTSFYTTKNPVICRIASICHDSEFRNHKKARQNVGLFMV